MVINTGGTHEQIVCIRAAYRRCLGLAPAFEKMGLDGKIDPFIGVVIRTIPIALITFVALFFMGRTHELARVDLKSAFICRLRRILAGLVGPVSFLLGAQIRRGVGRCSGRRDLSAHSPRGLNSFSSARR